MSLTVGDRVWYVIDGLGLVPPIWVAATIVTVGETRIGIRTAPKNRPRYVTAARLTTDAPPAGATTIVFPPVLAHSTGE